MKEWMTEWRIVNDFFTGRNSTCKKIYDKTLWVRCMSNSSYTFYADTHELSRFMRVLPQAAQTHVAREGCNVIYITYVTRAGVALQATVENIRDFVWEIYHWDLRTPNNVKPYFFLNEMNKKVLPAIYSAAVWCLFVVLLFFFTLLRNHCYSFHRTLNFPRVGGISENLSNELFLHL